jgi:CRP/FNR family transcriptional regulator, cyclic AMP receptor protein
MDLPHRVEAAFGLPVTHIRGEPEMDTRGAALAQVPLFSQLAKRHVRVLARASSLVNYRKGEAVITEGSPGSELFVVLDGKVKIVRNHRTIARMSAGDVVGEISVLDPGPRTADVIAETPARCLRLPGPEFRAAVRAGPALAGSLLQALGRRLRAMSATPAR